MVRGASRNGGSRQSSVRAATTSGPAADRGYDDNLPEIRRAKKKEKEKQRKQRRGEARRANADNKRAGAAHDGFRRQSNAQSAEAAAAATCTEVADCAGIPCTDEDAGVESRATKPPSKKATEKVVAGDVREQAHELQETAAGIAVAKPMSEVAVSVAEPMSQVAVPVSVAAKEAEKPVINQAAEVVVVVVVEAPSSSSSSDATGATVGGDSADEQDIKGERFSRQLAVAGCLDEGELVTIVGPAEAVATGAAAAAAVAEEAAAETTAEVGSAEEKKTAVEHVDLEQRLIQAVTKNLAARAEEEAAATKVRPALCLSLESVLKADPAIDFRGRFFTFFLLQD